LQNRGYVRHVPPPKQEQERDERGEKRREEREERKRGGKVGAKRKRENDKGIITSSILHVGANSAGGSIGR
jgi:hypothetical protein